MRNLFSTLTRLFLVLVFASSSISCAFSELDKASAPPEDYWKKLNFSKETSKKFLYQDCEYLKRPNSNNFASKSDFEAAYNKRLFEIEQCMLDNGFKFSLEGPATPGTLIWRGRCDSSRLSPSPACQSIKK
jgi:hypothetical protein